MRPEAERLVRANLRKAAAFARKADHYVEQASMATEAAFRVLEHNARMGTAEEARADRAYKAHKELSNARGELGDAVQLLEKPAAARSLSRDPTRRRRMRRR